MPDIVAINRTQGLALDGAGQSHPVVTWLDRFGHETTDGAEAAAAVVALNDGKFAAIDLSQFERTTTQ